MTDKQEELTPDQLAYIAAYKEAVLEIFENVKGEIGYEGEIDVVYREPEAPTDQENTDGTE